MGLWTPRESSLISNVRVGNNPPELGHRPCMVLSQPARRFLVSSVNLIYQKEARQDRAPAAGPFLDKVTPQVINQIIPYPLLFFTEVPYGGGHLSRSTL